MPKAKTVSVEIPANLCAPEFMAAWAVWVGYRIEIRKAMKPTTMAFQLKRLSEWGPERAIAAISYSIYQGYTGIFEEQGTHKQLDKPATQREEVPLEEF